MTQLDKVHHPDVIDRASELEMANTADAIQAVRARNVQKQVPGPDGAYPYPECRECDDEIPLARLQIASNNDLCIHCATIAERWRR